MNTLLGQAPIVLGHRERIINSCKHNVLSKSSYGIPAERQAEILQALEHLIDQATSQRPSICQRCGNAWGFLLLTPCCHLYW